MKLAPYGLTLLKLASTNSTNSGAIEYLKIFTLLSKEQIEAIEKDFIANPRARAAQKALAYEVTTLVHGADRADAAKRVSEALFSEDYTQLSTEDFELLAAEVKTIEVNATTPLVNVLVDTELAKSMTEARRFAQSGAVYLNGEKTGATSDLSAAQPLHGYVVIRRGKKDMALLKVA